MGSDAGEAGTLAAGRCLVEISFETTIIEWRGPAPFFFAPVPEEHVAAVRSAARLASYGWGVVPVTAVIGGVSFATSLSASGAKVS